MAEVTFNDLRVSIAEQFKEAASEPTPNTHYYLVYGKALAWANESSPDIANTAPTTVFEVWKNMIGAKKLTSSDMRHVIRRVNWSANTIYNQYDDRNPSLYDDNSNFYIVTSQNHVYKCISNNSGGMSNTEPTALNFDQSSKVVQDGYVWKYMYTLSSQDLLRYTTSDYIPVKTLSATDGSTQWDVQRLADPGAIENITITNPGSGYTEPSSLIVTISGDGTDATAFANVNTVSNTISSITMTSQGTGYTYADVTIAGGQGTGATARAIMSPPTGHGADALYELGGKNILINARIAGSEGGQIPVTHAYRQIALIADPLENDGVSVAANSIYEQTYTITTIGSGSYDVGEFVYQGTSATSTTFAGYIIEDNAGVIKVANHAGNPTVGTLIGANTGTARFVTEDITSPELTKYSGRLLYVDNIKPISRSSDQTEEFKIVIKF